MSAERVYIIDVPGSGSGNICESQLNSIVNYQQNYNFSEASLQLNLNNIKRVKGKEV